LSAKWLHFNLISLLRASCRRKGCWIPTKMCNSGRLLNHHDLLAKWLHSNLISLLRASCRRKGCLSPTKMCNSGKLHNQNCHVHSGYQRIRVSSFQFVFCCETRILILTHQWYLLIRIHQYISTSSPLFARGRFSHEIDSLLTTGYRQTTMMDLDGNWWKNWNLSLAESMTSADIIWQKNWTASDRPRPMSEKKSGQTQKRPKNRNRKPGLAHTECRWPRLICMCYGLWSTLRFDVCAIHWNHAETAMRIFRLHHWLCDSISGARRRGVSRQSDCTSSG